MRERGRRDGDKQKGTTERGMKKQNGWERKKWGAGKGRWGEGRGEGREKQKRVGLTEKRE